MIALADSFRIGLFERKSKRNVLRSTFSKTKGKRPTGTSTTKKPDAERISGPSIPSMRETARI